MGKNLLVIF